MAKKMGPAVGWAAIGMFAWGLLKASSAGKHLVACPLCVAHRVTDPKRLFHSLVIAPVTEELSFRSSLPRLVGSDPAALAFGALHASPKLGTLGNAARVAEAAIAGGLVYQRAYNEGGLLGAALVHGSHNLGADLGTFLTMSRRTGEESWAHCANSRDCRQLQRGA